MASIVIVVPKEDECRALRAEFDIPPGKRPDEYLPSDTAIWRTRVADLRITIARLNAQTNTYSGVRTLELIQRENPRQLFLAGTALGKAGAAPVGSVIIADRIGDVSERRPTPDNHGGWAIKGPIRPDSRLADEVGNFVWKHFKDTTLREHFYQCLDHEDLTGAEYRAAKRIVLANPPEIALEPILSGNEYIMQPGVPDQGGSIADRRADIWAAHPEYKAYDMEAAGFVLAAKVHDVPWLVFRAISDHGTRESKLDRGFASHAVARVLRQFLEDDPERPRRISSPAPRLPGDLAAKLLGDYTGYMGYWDDDDEMVVYREKVSVGAEGEILRANVRSEQVVGRGPSSSLDYRAEIRLGSGEYFSGIWAPGPGSEYSGSLTGREVSGRIAGNWAGGHRGGIRVGAFEWRDSREMQSRAQLDSALREFEKSLALLTRERKPLK